MTTRWGDGANKECNNSSHAPDAINEHAIWRAQKKLRSIETRRVPTRYHSNPCRINSGIPEMRKAWPRRLEHQSYAPGTLTGAKHTRVIHDARSAHRVSLHANHTRCERVNGREVVISPADVGAVGMSSARGDERQRNACGVARAWGNAQTKVGERK